MDYILEVNFSRFGQTGIMPRKKGTAVDKENGFELGVRNCSARIHLVKNSPLPFHRS